MADLPIAASNGIALNSLEVEVISSAGDQESQVEYAPSSNINVIRSLLLTTLPSSQVHHQHTSCARLYDTVYTDNIHRTATSDQHQGLP